MDEFARGWKPLLASMLGMACGIMAITFYTQSLFVEPITREFGWTLGQFYRGFTIMMVAGLITAPITGFLVDRLGPRPVGIAGLIGHAACYGLLSLNTGSLTYWYAGFFLLAVFSAGSLPIAWLRIVASWFDRRLGLAIGVTMAASGLMAVAAPPIVESLIEAYGWRGAYRALGGGALLLSLPVVLAWLHPGDAAQLASDRHDDPGMTVVEALKTYKFWALCIALALSVLAVVGPVSNLVPLMTHYGMPRAEAARLASILGAHVILGRLMVGTLFDRYWAPGVAAIFLVLPLPAIVLVATTPLSSTLAIAAAMTLGLATGAELDIIAYLTRIYFGRRHYGSIYGALFAFFTVASGLAPMIYGQAFDAFATYTGILLLSALLLFAAVALILSLGKTPQQSPA
ncbi:MAG: MFS transporter [Rhodothermales bacterium]